MNKPGILMNFRIYITAALFSLTTMLSGQNLSDMSFGTDTTFEVMTWNIEWFPKHNYTVDSVKMIVESLAIDVIAIQEIDEEVDFETMIDEMEGWEGYSMVSDYLEVGYIYNTENVEVDSIYEILTDNSRALPRPPLVMEVTWGDEQYIILNLHLKCCGDGYMNTANLWDEEVRRRDACILIENYISTNWPDEKIILLGDLNDLIQENESNNVFQVFIDDASSYRFLDMGIAEGDGEDWSYPSWPSHLDHILVSNELFNEFDSNNGIIETLKIEDYLPNGFSDYDYYISDHRPLAIKIFPPDITSSTNQIENRSSIYYSVYPNPVNDILYIRSESAAKDLFIEIYSLEGTLIDIQPFSGSTTFEYPISSLSKGIYFVRISSETMQSFTKKIIVE